MNQNHPSIDHLVDYTRGELSAREDANMHAHLAQCPQCTQAHDEELRLVELLKAHARAEERDLPLGLAEAIYARAKSDRTEPARWSWHHVGTLLRPMAAVAVAAVLVIAFLVSFIVPHGAQNNAIDAAAYMQNHAALASTMPFEDSAAVPATFAVDEKP